MTDQPVEEFVACFRQHCVALAARAPVLEATYSAICYLKRVAELGASARARAEMLEWEMAAYRAAETLAERHRVH